MYKLWDYTIMNIFSKGFGVFTNEEFMKGDFPLNYSGEMITADVAEKSGGLCQEG